MDRDVLVQVPAATSALGDEEKAARKQGLSSADQSGRSSPSLGIKQSDKVATTAKPLSSPLKISMLKSTIMVQNVPAKADRQDLISMFQCCGPVNSIYFHINQQGERSGSALVEFSSPAGATAALQLSGSVCMGVSVEISPSSITILAREQLDHEFRRQQIDPNNCLVAYVSSLPPKTNEEDLMVLFRDCGHVVGAKIIHPTLPSLAPPYAKVTFSSSSSCKAALEMDGAQFKGLPVTIDYVPPVQCALSPPPSSSILRTGDHDRASPMGFQWLEGLPGTPLCPKSKGHKDCTVEFTSFFSEPADDVFRQGRFVSRAKVNGNNYTKDVYFMGFKWDGREIRIGDVVLLEAEEGEWIARVEKCWEERKNLLEPQNNRRLVSLMWYYHKKDLLGDLGKKKLDHMSKHYLGRIWDDGNEILFSDHQEEELEIGCITGTNVTIASSEDDYFKLSSAAKSSKANSRVFLQRFTYENRSKIVESWQSMTPRTSDMVHAATVRAACSSKPAQRPRGLESFDLKVNQEAGGKIGGSKSSRAVEGGKRGDGRTKTTVISVSDGDNDDDRPLKKIRATPPMQHAAQQLTAVDVPQKKYHFQGWHSVKNDLRCFMQKLSFCSQNRHLQSQLDAEIGGLLSTVEERMPTYKDLQTTQVHTTIRELYKDFPNNNNANLARSIFNRWKAEFEVHTSHGQRKAALVQPGLDKHTKVPAAPATASVGLLTQCQTGPTFVQHGVPPVYRDKDDPLRTALKARLLRAFSDQLMHAALSDKARVQPSYCDVVSQQIELRVFSEYRGASDQYKRHIELLISHISRSSEFALLLLQGCIETSAVTSAVALKDGFLEAQRAGVFVANRLKSVPAALPALPILGGASDPCRGGDPVQASSKTEPSSSLALSGQSGSAEMRLAGASRSHIMAALAVQGDAQAEDMLVSGVEGWGWSLKDEKFDYGL